MSQYVFLRDTPSEHNGGVHINSGIPNYAFFLFATGAGMNKDKAEKVYYPSFNEVHDAYVEVCRFKIGCHSVV